MTNKEKAVALITAIGTGDEAPVAYIHPETYIQHNPFAPDGVEGFLGFLRHQPPGGYQTRVVRAFEDGDYVFTHSEGDLGGPKVFFDIFRFHKRVSSSSTGTTCRRPSPRRRAVTA